MVGAPPGARTVRPGAAAMPWALLDCCVTVDGTPSAPIWNVFCGSRDHGQDLSQETRE